MEQLNQYLNNRLEYLLSQPETDETDGRIDELSMAIRLVQQHILAGIDHVTVGSDSLGSKFVSESCEGERCGVSGCSQKAASKLEETVFSDNPNRSRHALTDYVCRNHFRMIVGNLG